MRGALDCGPAEGVGRPVNVPVASNEVLRRVRPFTKTRSPVIGKPL
jgi:hypothetical protein